MANDLTTNRTTWQGFLIEDPRVTASATAEYGMHTGPAVPGENTGDLVVRSLRVDRAAAQSALTLTCTRAGALTSTGVPGELKATVGTGAELGWMDPIVPWSFGYLGSSAFQELALGRRRNRWSAWLKSSDLAAYVQSEAHHLCPGALDGDVVYVDVYNATAAWVLRTTVYPDGVTTGVQTTRQPIPTGIIDPTTDEIVRLRVAVSGMQGVLLIQKRDTTAGAGDTADRIVQWASDDGGLSWGLVGDSSDSDGDHPHGLAAVVGIEGGFAVVYAVGDETGTTTTLDKALRVARVYSAAQGIWQAGYTTITHGTAVWDDTPAGQVGALHVGADVGEDGTLWLYTTTMGTIAPVTYLSTDGGASWTSAALVSTQGWAAWDAAGPRPQRVHAVAATGSFVLAWEAGSDVYLARCGGWSSAGITPYWLGGSPLRTDGWRTAAWTNVWYGTKQAPSDYGWTAAGSTTVTNSAAYTSWTGMTGARSAQTWTTSSAGADGSRSWALRFTGRADAPATNQAAPLTIELAHDNVASTAAVTLRLAIGDDEVRVYLRTGASTWSLHGSAHAHAFADAWVDWYAVVSLNSDTQAFSVKLWGREHGASIAVAAADLLDDWVEIVSASGTGTNVGANESGDRIAIGGSVQTGEVGSLSWFAYQTLPAALAVGNPDDITGRPLSAQMWAPPDVLVEIGQGRAAVGDVWTVHGDADGAADNALDSDVGVAWESTGTTQATLTLSWGAGQAGQMFGLLLRGVVAEDITVQGDGSVDLELMRSVPGFTADLSNDVIVPTSGALDVMIRENEGAGGLHLLLTSGSNVEAVRVQQTRAGHWGTVAPARMVVSTPVDVADGALDVDLLPADLLLIVHKSTDDYSSVDVVFEAATATWPTGTRWRVQRALVGPIVLLGDEWNWDEAMTTEVPVDEGRTSDGRSRPRALRPAYRRLSVSWTDGVDEKQAPADGDGNVVGDGPNAPTAWVGATAHTVDGLLSELRGAEGEVVVLLGVPLSRMTEDGSLTLTRREEFLHGRITSSVQRDQVLTNDTGGNLMRIGELVIEEIT